MATFMHQQLLQLTTMNCGDCGVTFAMTDHYIATRRADHKTFHCPNGCLLAWNGPSAAEREAKQAKERADMLEQQLASRNEDLRVARVSHAATKGQLTKTKKRAEAALCPHCNRSFVQLRRHLATKHPVHA